MTKKRLFIGALFLTAFVFWKAQAQAIDLGQTIRLIKDKILGADYIKQLSEGEFLLEGSHPNFQAYFGDRANNNKHRVKLAKGNLGFEFAFLEATGSVSPSASPAAKLTLDEPSSSNSSIISEADLNDAQKKVLGDIKIQLGDIETTQASISAKLDYLQKDLDSIDKEINNIIPGTNIGYDEVNKNQLVVKNSNLQSGIDVYYWKRDNDLREKIIIRYPPAPDRIIFTLKTQDLTPFDIGAGVIYFKDKDGKSIFRIDKGYIKDLTNAFSNNVRTLVEGDRLIHQLDRLWLSDPKRIYPLTIYFDFQLVKSRATGVVSSQPTPAVKVSTPSPTVSLSVTSVVTPTTTLSPVSTVEPIIIPSATPAALLISPSLELTPILSETPVPTEEVTE